MQQDNVKRIRNLRNKLHESIKKNGLDSDKTRKISDEMDKLINEYYDNIQQIEYPTDSEMKVYYEQSYKQLKIVTQQLERFPSTQEWNKFAKENCLLSSMSMQYISKLNWNYLRAKVLRELNMDI
nr:MAG TPA: Spo0E like sporulation regulatory protein [Caudoviricetes sp.]